MPFMAPESCSHIDRSYICFGASHGGVSAWSSIHITSRVDSHVGYHLIYFTRLETDGGGFQALFSNVVHL